MAKSTQVTSLLLVRMLINVLIHANSNTFGIGDYLGINVTTPQYTSIQRKWYFWPVEDPLGSNITCNFDGSESHPSYHAPVAAGGNVTAHYNDNGTLFPAMAWIHGTGPLLAYMAECPAAGCHGFDPSKGAIWFKIDQIGLMPGATTLESEWWQYPLLIAANVQPVDPPGYTVTIPKYLKPGNYLLRTEIIMLASNPAQFYPECAQLTVHGTGTKTPSDKYKVSFPGAYSPTG